MVNPEIAAMYLELKLLVASLEDDIQKASSGVKVAGPRLRKGIKLIRDKSQEIRKASLLKDED